MSTIPCPAPQCPTSWPDTMPAEVLTRLIDLHARPAHPATPAGPTAPPSSKAEKVKRPTIAAAGSSEEWAYFLLRWSDYKAATHLTGPDIIYQLLECCHDGLRKDLIRTFGALASEDEPTVLSRMKTLAVSRENIMIARTQLHQMRQDRDEPIRAFAARLRGQASICIYQVSCPCGKEVAYSHTMVRDALIRGLADEEIQLDILGETKQDMTLEDVLAYVEAKESGKRSASRISGEIPTATAAATSSYRRQVKGLRNA